MEQGDAVLRHPIREELWRLLGEMEVSGREACGYLPGPPTLETVNYHLLVLEQAGIAERVGGLWRRKIRRPNRGT